jgi:hypothetical protein
MRRGAKRTERIGEIKAKTTKKEGKGREGKGREQNQPPSDHSCITSLAVREDW